MRVRPLSPDALVDELADRLAALEPGRRLRVAFDGAPAAEPDRWADALVDPLRVRGRAVLRISTRDFLRAASLRYEHGRTNPDAFYERWLDDAALRREVLDPLAPGGSGRVLPSLWDPVTDRATRASYVAVPPGGVVLVSGALLLGAGLAFDVAVHFALTPKALARRTSPDWRWTLPAFARYEAEVNPARLADVVVRIDDPRHPAVVDSW
jgi:hypothetical protein